MIRRSKLIKLPQVLLQKLLSELDIQIGYLIKNFEHTANLTEEDKQFLEETKDVYRKFVYARTDLKEVYDEFVDQATLISDIKVDVMSFDYYQFKAQTKDGYSDLKKYTDSIYEKQKKYIERIDMFYGKVPKWYFSLPDPYFVDKKEIISKKMVLKSSDFAGLPYLKRQEDLDLIDQVGYVLELITVEGKSTENGQCIFVPNLKKFIIYINVDSEYFGKYMAYTIKEMGKTLEHELTHLVQYLMQDITSIKTWGLGKRRVVVKENDKTTWGDLNMEYKAQLRDISNRMLALNIDFSNYDRYLKDIEKNIGSLSFLTRLKQVSQKKYDLALREIYKEHH